MDKFLSTLPYGALFLPTLQKDIDRIDARLAGPKVMKRLAIKQLNNTFMQTCFTMWWRVDINLAEEISTNKLKWWDKFILQSHPRL